MSDLNPAPLKVAPLIKGLRWGLLLIGIAYGMNKQAYYSQKETKYREEMAKKKQLRRERIAAKRQAKLAKKEKNKPEDST